MLWSPQQDTALCRVADWIADKNSAQQVFRLFGYAGTGKTTLAKHLAGGVEGLTLFGAYTGKAAHVLKQKGCPDASTIHSLIYQPQDKSAVKLREYEVEYGTLFTDNTNPKRLKELELMIRIERENLKRPNFTLKSDSLVSEAKLVIIDECSMVDGQMGEDLLSFGAKVLVLGDPAQLPPIKGGGFFTDCEPDIMLTEIHRQAADNPIIDMATRVREGKPLPLGTYGSSRIVDKLDQSDAMNADQILLGRNLTRRKINNRMRQLHGKEGVVAEGDKLVCLRNNHEIGILNGSIWSVNEFFQLDDDSCLLTLNDDCDSAKIEVEAHTHYFLGRENELSWQDKRKKEEFDFGYALTCHKAQGSQWNNVLLLDEAASFRHEAKRWLYTAITRAADKITIKR